MIDFNEIPSRWPLCPGYDCPQKDTCLRHVTFKQAPQSVERWRCLLPTVLAKGTCCHYRKAEQVTMAGGFSALWEQLHSRDARRNIRLALTSFFSSKGSYYRYKHGERLMTPEQQASVAAIFRQYGFEGEIAFDSYETRCDFS